MSNAILTQNTVIRQCLSILPAEDLACPLLHSFPHDALPF